MNPFCTESTIRKAADWRAFKQGSDLISSVSDAAATETGWRGVVRDGRRPLRVSVIARSPTDIEACCPCRENQSTGAFCAHAVAVGLTLASEKVPSTAKPVPKPARSAPAPKAVAWDVQLPPPWRRMLASGRLAVKVAISDESPDAADAHLTTLLTDLGATKGGMLQLDGGRLAGFLAAAADHPRVACEGTAVEISPDALMRVATVERDGECVVITPQSGEMHRIGNLTAEISENRISLVTSKFPAELAPLSSGNPACLPLHAFLDQAESLGGVLVWPEEGWLSDLSFVAAKPDIEITLGATGRGLDARPLVRYGETAGIAPGGGTVPGLPALDGNTCRMRDRRAEMQVVEMLERQGFERADDESALWRLSDENRIADFLSEMLPALLSRYTIHHGPGLAKRLRDAATVTPRFKIQGSGEDWLSFDLSFQTSDTNKKIDSAEVWHMLKTGGGGKRSRLSRDLSEIIEPLFEELDLVQEQGRFVARGASADCIRQLCLNDDKKHKTNEIKEIDFTIPATVSADLRAYQRAGVAWVTSRLESWGGALLADDMGLGKTIQAIASMERLFEVSASREVSVLVVATTSLLGNWAAEYARFAPGRRVRILHGKRRDAEKEKAGAGEVWLTSYGTLARDLAWYLRRDFLAVVVDEASLMRNPDTDHAKALFKLKAAHRLALTGTPVENGVRDLWSIFRFIQPGWLGGRSEFQERYETSVGTGDVWALRRLRVKTAPFLLRRTKQEVAPELPAKMVIDEFCEMSRDQQSVYRELLVAGRRGVEHLEDAGNRGAARMQMLTTLLRLRQACCDLALLKIDRLKQMNIAKRSAKLERLLELLDEAVSGGHRVLVFSQFRSQLDEIRACLEVRGMACLQLDGRTRDRQAKVDHFQAADGPPVFLISLKAGGYGLNLTAADVVIHFDPWWNPAAEAQATDRAHRIGQSRPVTVYRLLTRGTVEEKVVSLQRRKRAIASAIDESGSGDAAGWSERELAALLE